MSGPRLTRTRRRWVLNAVLAVTVLAVAGASVWLLYRPAEASSGATVRTVAVATGSVTATVSADGTVEPVREVVANFATSGTIATIGVAVGDKVRKGQRLATLERATARRALKVARASLDAAQANLSSAQASLASAEDGTTTTDQQTGVSTTTVSESQVAQAEAQVSSARIQVLQADAGVEDATDALAATTLRAPIAGTVLEVNGTVGSASGSSAATSTGATSAGTGTSNDFIVIANLSRMQVAVSFSEADVAGLTVGQRATITFPALTDVTARGRITRIDPVGTVSSSVVTFGVTVRLTSAPAQVRVGQSASVTVTTGSATGVLVVPSVTVTTTGSRSTVTVLRDGQQSVVPVEVGVEGAAMTQIVSGLAAGDQVVLTSTSATGSSSSSSDDPGFPGGGLPGAVPGAVPGGGGPAAPPGGTG